MTNKMLVTSPSAPPAGPYSPALAAGEWLFLAGQTGLGETIEDQTESALGKVAALLSAAGCAPADVVSCLVHLADLADFERFNAVYEGHFPEPRPVRTTVGAALLGGAQVEITAVARRPGRIDAAETVFASAADLASALRRAEAAHGEHEKRTGQRDENWPDWYAAYLVAEQSGTELPA